VAYVGVSLTLVAAWATIAALVRACWGPTSSQLPPGSGGTDVHSSTPRPQVKRGR
jgi:hypothetical protein